MLTVAASYWVTPFGLATLAGAGLTYGIVSAIGSESFDNWVYTKIKK